MTLLGQVPPSSLFLFIHSSIYFYCLLEKGISNPLNLRNRVLHPFSSQSFLVTKLMFSLSFFSSLAFLTSQNKRLNKRMHEKCNIKWWLVKNKVGKLGIYKLTSQQNVILCLRLMSLYKKPFLETEKVSEYIHYILKEL